MTQRVPADANLGRTKANMPIGYKILTLTRSVFKPFTRIDVTETGIPGRYVVTGEVEAPDAGGWIVWGTADQDMAEAKIDPVEVDNTESLLAGVRMALDALLARIAVIMPATPVVQMETAYFDTGVNVVQSAIVAMRADVETLVFELAGQFTSSSQQQAERVSEIQTQLAAIIETTSSLQVLNDSARQVQALAAIRDRISEVIGAQMPVTQIITDGNEQLAGTLTAMRADMNRLNGVAETLANRQPDTINLVNGSDAQLATVLETLRSDVDGIAETIKSNNKSGESKARAIAALNKILETAGQR